ncbi:MULTISPECIES: hypothetical protein [unclassified Streptomyces]|uniref:hypothetical protein n=1 Tax=unclassified Streptomyces TaxID=2593676 RepID=UPI00225A7052|nr:MULTISPECIES: hypothetical protein [unclassified Streptomyces]MCX4411290.1 hypothetical protein [Streptomyces sp. NBC_01764]MCX5192249.1 hypothetical protein [Streptomyces sp. NBC_00268]
MKKLMRRIATASVSAVFVGGTLLATGGSATAATLPDGGLTPARVVVTADTKTTSLDSGQAAQHRLDPWVQGQLLAFNPWIQDQLALFAHYGDLGHR